MKQKSEMSFPAGLNLYREEGKYIPDLFHLF
jgi:hypothetical protein